jgi:predicted MPP superfamily phosphohydrolase
MEFPLTESDFPRKWDAAWVEGRRLIESRRILNTSGWQAEDGIHLPFHYRFLKWSLKAAGLYARGYRNFTDVRITRLHHSPTGWPKALDGFRILQLSDLHIDLDPALQPVIRKLLPSIGCDLAVITGDFWEGAGQHPEESLPRIREILQLIGEPAFGKFGILGNHDALVLAAALEKMGLPLLINEAVTLGQGASRFALAGVDDPFFFRTDDVWKAAAQCPRELPRILLSHSPQVAPAALDCGFCLMLSGHTHGGQICLPGGHALLSMENIPTPLFRGLWRRGSLIGYTSTGTGSCHVPVRYNCPPEIVLHTLNAAV